MAFAKAKGHNTMANEIKETSIRRIQTQLNQLTTLLPNLQDEGHPAGQLWSEILQELHQLTKDLDRQEELIDQRIEQVITLHNISSRLGSHLDLTALLNDLAEFSAKLMGADVSVVKLADERQQSFTTQASYSMLGSPTTSTDQSEELTANIDFQVIQTKEAVLANDWPNHPLAAATETRTNLNVSAASSANKILAVLSVPIILQGEVTGIIEVQSFTNNHAFDENDLHILSLLAGHAATAIKNTQLYNRAENSYRFLKTVIEHIPDPIFIKDKNYTLIEMNQANAAIIGHREAELIGKTDFDLFPSELADKFRHRDDEVFSGNELVVAEDKTVWADGQEHIGYTRLVPIPDPSGQPEYLLGITQDVTERKAREAEREQLLAETTALYNGSQSITRALSERQIFDALFDQIRQHDPCEISAFRFHLVEDEPLWTELVANWQKRNNPTYPEKTRFYLRVNFNILISR